MRLAELDEARAQATLIAALDAGATLLDTADVYGRDARDTHGNERWIASVLATREHPRPRIVTKAGLVRHDGARWIPNGQARHLRVNAHASREALGVDALDLLLLHAPDPRTPIATSVRALDALRREGIARAIGLSNVSLRELDAALAITELDAVELALSPFDEARFRSGVIERALERGLMVLAHAPLGGPQRARRLPRDPTLARIADKHGVSAADIVLAWLRDLAPNVVPIPGPRTPETARAAVHACHLALDDEDRAALDARYPFAARTRPARSSTRSTREGEVVIVMGLQGAGKSTLARELEQKEYLRLNRDELGGTLRGIAKRLDRALSEGARRVVLDNTYASRASRSEVIDVAAKHDIAVRCVWIDVPMPIAQANVARRMIEGNGALLAGEALRAAARRDPSVLPPNALSRLAQQLEPPHASEGFARVEVVPFARRARPTHDRAAVIVALDALVHGLDDVRVDDARLATLHAQPVDVRAAIGWMPQSDARGEEQLARWLERVRTRLGVNVSVCSHPAGPPICWCRPPLPGLAVELVEKERLDVARVTLVTTRDAQRTIAEGIGSAHVPAGAFFSDRA
jgi:aryl-alcohol dehydrogenase-like predicted oxidoreductase/predicted kinase